MNAPGARAARFRKRFPMLDSKIHLASCSLGARSLDLDEAVDLMLDDMAAGGAPWDRFEGQVTEARQRFAALIGAEVDQVAVVPNASVGAYQVASTSDWSTRSKIVTTALEFPSVAHVWLAQQPRGAEVVYAERYEELVDGQTGLVSVPMTTYQDARRLPVADVVRLAHDAGAKAFVDAYQAVGTEPVDVERLGCDYLVAGTMKYLLGLPGLAFLYVRDPESVHRHPRLTGWFGRTNPFAFDPRTLDFAATAARFETGTPAVPAAYTANAGLRLIGGLDLAEVRAHVLDLQDHAIERLAAQGEQVRALPRDERGAHIGLLDRDPAGLAKSLAQHGVATSPRGEVVRLSFHYYTDASDVAGLCAALAEVRQFHPIFTLTEPITSRAAGSMSTAELRSWLHEPDPKKFPYEAVVRHYHLVGKHFVDPELLKLLAEVRDKLPTMRGPWYHVQTLAQFLSTALDKPDERYDYPTYLALSLLQLPTVDDPLEQATFARSRCDRLVVQLVADSLAFEIEALEGRTTLFPEMRPSADLVTKRCKHGVRTIRPALERLSLHGGLTATEPVELARQACSIVNADMSFSERRAIELSNLPVYTSHDEYMFLRVLQSFETTFSLLAVQLRAVVAALGERDVDRAVHLLASSETAMAESAPLFSMLATMQIESFRTFRNFTEGASAIQSRNYKIVESLCRTPDRDRVDSPAFHSVPEVRKRVVSGQTTLDDAYRAAIDSGDLSPEQQERLGEAMKGFARALLRWRNTHYRLAVRMLGEASGTGYTEGTPYLKSVRDIPVFQSVDVTDEDTAPTNPART